MKSANSVEEYIKMFPSEQKKMLTSIRQAIRDAAPEAEEGISYGMPGYKLNGPLVYFGGFKKHCSFFPAGNSAISQFNDELKKYHTSKGTIQLPLDEPLPVALIKKIVRARVKENAARLKEKKALKKTVK